MSQRGPQGWNKLPAIVGSDTKRHVKMSNPSMVNSMCTFIRSNTNQRNLSWPPIQVVLNSQRVAVAHRQRERTCNINIHRCEGVTLRRNWLYRRSLLGVNLGSLTRYASITLINDIQALLRPHKITSNKRLCAADTQMSKTMVSKTL